jgi:hypothetical protein
VIGYLGEFASGNPRAVGDHTATLDRIRLSRGVVAKASYVAGIALIVLGGIALRLTDPTLLLITAGVVALIFILYFAGAL